MFCTSQASVLAASTFFDRVSKSSRSDVVVSESLLLMSEEVLSAKRKPRNVSSRCFTRSAASASSRSAALLTSTLIGLAALLMNSTMFACCGDIGPSLCELSHAMRSSVTLCTSLTENSLIRSSSTTISLPKLARPPSTCSLNLVSSWLLVSVLSSNCFLAALSSSWTVACSISAFCCTPWTTGFASSCQCSRAEILVTVSCERLCSLKTVSLILEANSSKWRIAFACSSNMPACFLITTSDHSARQT
mmetsp:Transcript_26683/g.67094  ORF Transcript_26683/g.67094 Transcript_26683/m.67094 type:complete len:248 (-) Transcript_26683:77-820(-)